jgi:hypothetical protein
MWISIIDEWIIWKWIDTKRSHSNPVMKRKHETPDERRSRHLEGIVDLIDDGEHDGLEEDIEALLTHLRTIKHEDDTTEVKRPKQDGPWKTIANFSRYEISPEGEIRNAKTHEIKRLCKNRITVSVQRDDGPWKRMSPLLLANLAWPPASREGEVWKEIPGHPLYEISNMGNVRSLKTEQKKELKQSTRDGYKLVMLSERVQVTEDGRQYIKIENKSPSVHRLVAAAFVPNPDNLGTVDHINGNRSDNRYTNLRWMTRKANISAAVGTPVRGTDPSSGESVSFASCADAMRFLNRRLPTDQRSISNNNNMRYYIINKIVLGGYVWSYQNTSDETPRRGRKVAHTASVPNDDEIHEPPLKKQRVN